MDKRMSPAKAVLYAKARMPQIAEGLAKARGRDKEKASSSNPTTPPTSPAATSSEPPQSAPISNSSND